MPSISRWMPCTWYVSLKPSMSVFQLQSARHRDQRLASGTRRGAAHAVSAGTGSRNSASGLGVGVEVHEHHRAPGVDLHVDERVVVVEHAELAPRRHLAQAAVEVPRPAVERAADLGEVGAGAAAQLAAAVEAHVLERAQHAVVAADDQHREPPDAVLVPVARAARRGRRCRRAARRAATRSVISRCEELGRRVARHRDLHRGDAGGCRCRRLQQDVAAGRDRRRVRHAHRMPRTSLPGRAPVSSPSCMVTSPATIVER